MLERQREGVAKAKAEGKYKGRAPTARAKAVEVRRLPVNASALPRLPSACKSAGQAFIACLTRVECLIDTNRQNETPAFWVGVSLMQFAVS
jgi:DNA invertase Pin-like site-specific DNA recombinase